jgi:hypothetical protein
MDKETPPTVSEELVGRYHQACYNTWSNMHSLKYEVDRLKENAARAKKYLDDYDALTLNGLLGVGYIISAAAEAHSCQLNYSVPRMVEKATEVRDAFRLVGFLYRMVATIPAEDWTDEMRKNKNDADRDILYLYRDVHGDSVRDNPDDGGWVEDETINLILRDARKALAAEHDYQLRRRWTCHNSHRQGDPRCGVLHTKFYDARYHSQGLGKNWAPLEVEPAPERVCPCDVAYGSEECEGCVLGNEPCRS